jgi:hypothetical protein
VNVNFTGLATILFIIGAECHPAECDRRFMSAELMLTQPTWHSSPLLVIAGDKRQIFVFFIDRGGSVWQSDCDRPFPHQIQHYGPDEPLKSKR